MENQFFKPNTFILGPSGTGKSTSIRNLNPETTVILNAERKALPFKKGRQFKKNVFVNTLAEFKKYFKKALESDGVEVIVVESFTSLCDIVSYSYKHIEGFDFWKVYKEEIADILLNSKISPSKYIFFIGIDQVIENADGIEERFIGVDGSWKKKVEKEFVNVLYATTQKNENGELDHVFITNKKEGYDKISCKSPMDMFPSVIPNDLKLVCDYIDKYYELEEEPQPEKKKTAKIQKLTDKE